MDRVRAWTTSTALTESESTTGLISAEFINQSDKAECNCREKRFNCSQAIEPHRKRNRNRKRIRHRNRIRYERKSRAIASRMSQPLDALQPCVRHDVSTATAWAGRLELQQSALCGTCLWTVDGIGGEFLAPAL